MRSAALSSSIVLSCLAAFAFGGPSLAADLPNGPANYPALTPAVDASASNPWSGLYVGTGISAWGGKGVKGGVGGEGYLGFDHTFDNGVVVGVRAASGYEPFLLATPSGFTRFTGTAFAGGEATVGYRMGQFTPYLIAGVDLARPTAFAGAALSPLDALNSAFSGPGAVQAVGTVGMGFTYQVTPNFSVGLEGRMYKANNLNYGLAPLPY
jgi:opacity protein-like surface antigen